MGFFKQSLVEAVHYALVDVLGRTGPPVTHIGGESVAHT